MASDELSSSSPKPLVLPSLAAKDSDDEETKTVQNHSLVQLIAEALESAPRLDNAPSLPVLDSITIGKKDDDATKTVAEPDAAQTLAVDGLGPPTPPQGLALAGFAALAPPALLPVLVDATAIHPLDPLDERALDEPFASIAVEMIETEGASSRPERTAEPLVEGAVIARRYRVEGRLATSGMSVLYRAVDLETERMVVVKLLHGHVAENKDAVGRFQREARLMGRVKSEHVARVLDVGSYQRCPFIAMELLEGSDLAQLLKQVGRLPLVQACDLVLQICEALAVAHAHGIVHRDLKPANVFVSVRPGGDLRVTIIDFGIAKAFVQEDKGDDVVTQNALLIGSPRYMAPEQVDRARDIDGRADIWALGVIFQEILTGEPVFDAEGVVATLLAIATKAPVPLRERWPEAPDAIVRVIDSALVKARDGRMPNVLLFAEQVAAFASADAAQRVRNIAASAAKSRGFDLQADGAAPAGSSFAPPSGATMSLRAAPLSDPRRPSAPMLHQASPMSLSLPPSPRPSMSAGATASATMSRRAPPNPSRSSYVVLVVVGLVGAAVLAVGAYAISRPSVVPRSLVQPPIPSSVPAFLPSGTVAAPSIPSSSQITPPQGSTAAPH